MFENILCEFYCLGLHKRLNSSRHHVHCLASKSDSAHKGRFKAKSYLSFAEYYQFMYSLYLDHVVAFSLRQIPFLWRIVGKLVYIYLFWADFAPKIECAPNVLWDGSEEVKCFLPRGKSHGKDGTSKPFMSEWEVDVVFESKH